MMKYFTTMVLVGSCLCGCSQTRQTDPDKTATELYLLSTAVQNSIRPIGGEMMRGRTVYVDARYIPDKNHDYLIASVRSKLLVDGARISNDREKAEIIVELRTPGVSIDRSEFFIGIPGIPIGQLAGVVGVPPTPLTTPELAVVKNVRQWGTAGVAFVAYWNDTGEIVASSGPHIGRSYREDWNFFGLRKTISDIPPTKSPEYDEARDIEQDQ